MAVITKEYEQSKLNLLKLRGYLGRDNFAVISEKGRIKSDNTPLFYISNNYCHSNCIIGVCKYYSDKYPSKKELKRIGLTVVSDEDAQAKKIFNELETMLLKSRG